MLRRVFLACLALAGSLVGVTASPARAAFVDIDRSFGNRGTTTVDLAAPSIDVANTAGGSFVHGPSGGYVAGSANGHMALAAFQGTHSAGVFGNRGRVVADFGRPSSASAMAVGTELITLAGSAGDDFAIATFEEDDGSPGDLLIGGGPPPVSQATATFGGPAVARGLVVDQWHHHGRW